MAYGPSPSFKWPTFEQFQRDFSNLSAHIKDADNLALTPDGKLVTAVDLARQTNAPEFAECNGNLREYLAAAIKKKKLFQRTVTLAPEKTLNDCYKVNYGAVKSILPTIDYLSQNQFDELSEFITEKLSAQKEEVRTKSGADAFLSSLFDRFPDKVTLIERYFFLRRIRTD